MLLKCKKYLKLDNGAFWQAGEEYEITNRDVLMITKENPGADFLANFEPVDDDGKQYYENAKLSAGNKKAKENG